MPFQQALEMELTLFQKEGMPIQGWMQDEAKSNGLLEEEESLLLLGFEVTIWDLCSPPPPLIPTPGGLRPALFLYPSQPLRMQQRQRKEKPVRTHLKIILRWIMITYIFWRSEKLFWILKRGCGSSLFRAEDSHASSDWKCICCKNHESSLLGQNNFNLYV